jgi:hypothetical protein
MSEKIDWDKTSEPTDREYRIHANTYGEDSYVEVTEGCLVFQNGNCYVFCFKTQLNTSSFLKMAKDINNHAKDDVVQVVRELQESYRKDINEDYVEYTRWHRGE